MKKHTLLILVLTISLSLVLVGCNNSEEATEETIKPLVIMQGVDATSLDPAMHSDSPSGNVDHQIFDTLLKRDSEMKIQPHIFTEWEMIDELKWEFSIKEDVKFHNGNLLTAEDVKFSIERII